MTHRLKKHQLGPVEFDQADFQRATGTQSEDLQTRLVHQLLEAVCLTSELSMEELGRRMKAAVATLAEIKPRDSLEGMLCVQMVATHDAAMECLRRAAQEGQRAEIREIHGRHATRLLNTYLHQLDALTRHRGRGTPTVTVQDVRSAAGAHAIVDAAPVRTVPELARAATAQADPSAVPVPTEPAVHATKPKPRRAAA